MFRTLWQSMLALGVAVSVGAQSPVPAPHPGIPNLAATAVAPDPLHASGKDVTISLLTMGNGNEVWELFGHDALLIHDNVSGRDTVFNWGVFSFQQTNFILHFLEGRNLYAMGGDSMGLVMYAYQYMNRPVRLQELDLTPSQRETILNRIRWNALPENVNYHYDYYRDNCSTRVRDVIDEALGGQLRAQSQTPSGTSYRWHTLRLMQGMAPVMLGVEIGLGRPADRELTKWEEMFLPRQLHDFVATMQVRDSAGAMHPLVRQERVLFESTRGPEPSMPPSLGGWLLFGGVVIAGAFVWLGARASAGGRGARAGAAFVIGLWSIAAGLLGVVVTLLWAVTNHAFAYANENLLLFNPLWLVLGVLLIGSLWRGRASPWTQRLAVGLAALGTLALVAHGIHLSAQNNLPIIALALPPALAIAWWTKRSA